MADPFTECHSKIWDALLARQAWTDLVKRGNRQAVIPRSDLESVQLDNNAPADYPEFLLTQGGFRLKPKGDNSKVVSGSRTYILQIASGAISVTLMNEIVWETHRALIAAGDTLGLSFVREWDLEGGTEGTTDNKARSASGWVAVLNIVVQMYWPRATLLAL